MHSGMGNLHNRLGFPIRRFLDHSSVTSSLRLIASSYVLHRLSTPRHPPYALNDLVMPTRLRLLKVEIKINKSMTEFARVSVSPCYKRIPVAIVCSKEQTRMVKRFITNIFRSLSKKLFNQITYY